MCIYDETDLGMQDDVFNNEMDMFNDDTQIELANIPENGMGFSEVENPSSRLVTVPNMNESPSNFNNISFTGLIDGGLTNSSAYNSWLDGISPLEIKPSDIKEIADHIADEFSQAFPDVKLDLFGGGFSTVMADNGTLYYDAVDVLKNDAAGYGAGNVVGSIAHEMGHNIVERVFNDSGIALTRLQHEIGADFIEGVVLGMTDIDPQGKFEFLRDVNQSSNDYLSAEERIDVIEQGIEWGDRLQSVGDLCPDLMLDVGDNEILRNRLMDIMDDYTEFDFE